MSMQGCSVQAFHYTFGMENLHRKILQHNGKTIIFHDYRHLEGQTYVQAVEYNGQQVEQAHIPQRLVLIDVTDSVVDKDVFRAFKRVSKSASSTVSKTAVVGVSGIQKLFLNTIAAISKLEIQLFDNQDAAKDWLVSS